MTRWPSRPPPPRADLVSRRVGVDLELAADRRARARDAAREDAGARSRPRASCQAMTKSAVGVGRHRSTALVVRGGGVGSGTRRPGERRAREGAAKTPWLEPSWPKLCQATTKSPSASRATDGAVLAAQGVGVDLELAARPVPGSRTGARRYRCLEPSWPMALPGDDEVSVGGASPPMDTLARRWCRC